MPEPETNPSARDEGSACQDRDEDWLELEIGRRDDQARVLITSGLSAVAVGLAAVAAIPDLGEYAFAAGTFVLSGALAALFGGLSTNLDRDPGYEASIQFKSSLQRRVKIGTACMVLGIEVSALLPLVLYLT